MMERSRLGPHRRAPSTARTFSWSAGRCREPIRKKTHPSPAPATTDEHGNGQVGHDLQVRIGRARADRGEELTDRRAGHRRLAEEIGDPAQTGSAS